MPNTNPIDGATLKLFNGYKANINGSPTHTVNTSSAISPGQGTISNLLAGEYTLAVSNAGKGTNVTDITLPGTSGMEGLNKIVNRSLLPGRATFTVKLEDNAAANIINTDGRFLINNIDAVNSAGNDWVFGNLPIKDQQKYEFIPVDDTVFQAIRGTINVPQSGGDSQLLTIFPPIRVFIDVIDGETFLNINSVARVWVKRPGTTTWEKLTRLSGQAFLADKGIDGVWGVVFAETQTSETGYFQNYTFNYLGSTGGDITENLSLAYFGGNNIDIVNDTPVA